ncbi:MAG: phosphoribosylanthranilate isomerase [Bacteroidetes bacterium]|nr:phosphoribosylanthranilate isomerase [Bacteroidota bacterium]MBS1931184.1 phosphoribosylanthranilate isomerase [Bacteroidota bacterium]
MNIKVCGITTMKQLQQLDGLDIDFAGLNFYKGSPRYVGEKISATEIQNADFDVKKVGVFVDAEYDDVMKTVDEYSLDIVQLHGNETPELCSMLAEDIEVIKVFRIDANTKNVDDLLKEFDDVCDYYLFDAGGQKENLGGTGVKFDWNLLVKAKIEKPFFLSGGIGPDDVAKIKAFRHPDFFAIDVNSKFETAPGVKDMAKLLKFVKELR